SCFDEQVCTFDSPRPCQHLQQQQQQQQQWLKLTINSSTAQQQPQPAFKLLNAAYIGMLDHTYGTSAGKVLAALPTANAGASGRQLLAQFASAGAYCLQMWIMSAQAYVPDESEEGNDMMDGMFGDADEYLDTLMV